MMVSTLSSSVPNCTTRIQVPFSTAVSAIHQPSRRWRREARCDGSACQIA